MNEVRYLMSQKQLNRYSVISKLIEGSITTLEAAESLDLSERQKSSLSMGLLMMLLAKLLVYILQKMNACKVILKLPGKSCLIMVYRLAFMLTGTLFSVLLKLISFLWKNN